MSLFAVMSDASSQRRGHQPTPVPWLIPARKVTGNAIHSLLPLQLVTEQGDGVTTFREVMIRQNRDDLPRKQLELQGYSFVVWFGEGDTIAGVEMSDPTDRHVLRWHAGQQARYFRVRNEARGYHNVDHLLLNGVLPKGELLAMLEASRANLTAPCYAALCESIRSCPH